MKLGRVIALFYCITSFIRILYTRSPLNVVHAGLDLLRDQVLLQFLGESGRAILELLDDIAAASTTAISILDDLLNYENIDAGRLLTLTSASKTLTRFHWIGSFKLDLSWKLLERKFGQNFKWAELLAAKKNIHCEIIDETGADPGSDHSSNASRVIASFCRLVGIIFSFILV